MTLHAASPSRDTPLRSPAFWLALFLIALGWLTMLDMVRTDLARLETGPGMDAVLRLALAMQGVPSELWASLCRTAASGGPSFGAWADACGMAAIMTVAMMLPCASPAWTMPGSQDAPRAGIAFLGGYCGPWLLFSLCMASVDIGLQAWIGDHVVSTPGMTGMMAAGLVIAAGLFQFTSTKRHARLTLARRNMPAGSHPTFGTPLRAGTRYGFCCLRSNGLLMSTMLVLGMMNLVAMALLTLIMIAEKRAKTDRLSALIGVVLVAVGIWWAWLPVTA